MGKKIGRILIAIILVLLALCFIPNPITKAKAADGGTEVYSTIIPVFLVVDWNQCKHDSHSDKLNPDSESYDPNAPRGETIKGKQIYIFDICIYDGRYTVEGIHTR